MKRWLFVLATAPLLALLAPTAWADAGCAQLGFCGEAGDSGVEVTGGTASGGSGDGDDGGSTGGKHFAYSYVPTCSVNSPDNPEALCGAAVMSCSARGLQGIQMWVYRREVDAAGRPLTPWDMVDIRCVGSFTPRTPDQVRMLLLSDSRFIPAPTSHTRLNPASGRTVVNAEVVFSADTPVSYSTDVPILGFTVRLDLAPEQWTWHFGDGAELVTQTAGRPYPDKDVVHRYRGKGAFAPYVTVTWGGTFTFNGVAYPINGTATVDGPASAVRVGEAKGQLVGGPNG